MKRESNGKLLRIFVGESDRLGAQPLYTAIVQAAMKAGLAGATVFKGIEGYGSHAIVHAARVFDLSHDLPVLIEIIDSEEKVRAFTPVLDEMIKDGLVSIEAVEVTRYSSKE